MRPATPSPTLKRKFPMVDRSKRQRFSGYRTDSLAATFHYGREANRLTVQRENTLRSLDGALEIKVDLR